jgi:prepilin-type N-terminal cleavage/methylation domain-containing protein
MKMFKGIREQKGFTLIELAIVLVIIGIIIGAVLKGQDLIESARIKRFHHSMTEWETSIYTFLDRKNLFPGDSDLNGIIGDSATATSAGQAIASAKFVNPPVPNPMIFGSIQLWLYFGNDGEANPRNIMAVCGNVDCQNAFDEDQMKYIESFDALIDGTVNGEAGDVTCDRPITLFETATDTNERIVKLLASTVMGSPMACDGSLTTAMVYYFSKGSSF